MILIIDNTLNLEKAYMTPIIIEIIQNYNKHYLIISDENQLNDIDRSQIKGIILSGGSYCLSKELFFNNIKLNIIVLNIFDNIPIMGICFGFQLLCSMYGSKVNRFDKYIDTTKFVNLDTSFALIKNNDNNVNAYFSHIDYIDKAPENFYFTKVNNIIIAIEHTSKPIYGFQFHPEGHADTHYILQNFIDIAFKKN